LAFVGLREAASAKAGILTFELFTLFFDIILASE
jgi:hypothetical protein